MKTSTSLRRREFLLSVGLGGAGAAAALIAGKSGQDAKKAVDTKTGGGSGYRVTEHVRNYYRTTRV